MCVCVGKDFVSVIKIKDPEKKIIHLGELNLMTQILSGWE